MYVDESGGSEMSDSTNFFVTCGIIFHESDLNSMKNRIQNYKTDNFNGKLKDAEIHLYHIWKGRGKFHGINFKEKMDLLDPLYSVISEMQFTVISISIDKEKFSQRHSDHDEILDYGYMLLAERFDNFLTEHEEKGIIRLDRITRPDRDTLEKKDKRILNVINKVRKKGTRWQLPAKSIIEEPMFMKSHTRKGLQIADAIAYCTFKIENKHQHFDGYWNSIYSKFRTSPSGKIIGYGLVRYPK